MAVRRNISQKDLLAEDKKPVQERNLDNAGEETKDEPLPEEKK